MRLLSVYLVPIGVALVSILALVSWNSHYVANDDVVLPLRVVAEKGTPLTPEAALRQLARVPGVERYDTHLSEAPVWFSLHSHNQGEGRQVIEFPSRHAIEIACWDGATLQALGSASHEAASGALSAAKAGFVLQPRVLPVEVLCRARFTGPARVSAVQWPAEEMTLSIQQFHRKSGLLDGGMIVLSLFILITALINRQLLYLQFAVWLILNLRVGAISAGWDIQWLGQTLPQDWLAPSRAMTTALYGIATMTLYMKLFGADLASSRLAAPLRVAQALCLCLLPMAILLPFGIYLPVMWLLVAPGLALMTLGLFGVMRHTQARVAMWFAASFAVTFLSTLAEVLSAALGMREMLGVVNSVTAALASSLLAALAVAEQMRLETQKRIAVQAELEHAYEAMPVGLFTLDLQGAFLSANPALSRMLGYEVLAQNRTLWQQFFADASWFHLREQVHQQTTTELELADRTGERRFLVRATLAHGRIEGVLEDITEKTKATEQLQFMANNDPLTRVYNRRGIEKMFEGAATSLAAGKPMAIAYIDLDRFKLINDLFGHGAGDEVLKQVCERMAMMLAGGQQIGRVGGDEFVIVMPDTAIPLASLICRGIVERIGGTPYRVGDKAFHVRGSVGLIEVSSGMPMRDAISAADRACREAKDASDGLVVYERNASAFHEREAELNLVAKLQGPSATEGLFIEMQPIMSLKNPHDSLNFEVLLRMRGPDGRIMPAGPLIGAAEKCGRAGMIDRWVLSTTLGWIADNIGRLPNTRFVCMNLSGASLNDERFVADTLEILARHVHVAGRLCMEITESVALHDLDNTRRFIDQVRNFGVKVALDDFGAGYTSFSYLKELPADVLKIDGNFIVNINAHPANVAIVEAIVSLAVNLGMKTIAEWAEDAATVQTLAEIGVDYVQGWAVARSQPPERLLTAASAASFITDPELLEMLPNLGKGAALDLQGFMRLY
ncbi:bifunctional diguanylate cyclase/phosphodiesterase [Massilia sp. Leaf139]|uniref:putative bifunctional diguanylate cyclase/phosphodiesterase n=1 Tax=Massilia sp. Leaf139 TaxID=1736272 RepID=UPI000700A4DF|nr:EAL domain-containing protein [Massilia sp. Leaf139]KQQ96805.1 diguanylate cyclase [Massilia sp. Leaf139]